MPHVSQTVPFFSPNFNMNVIFFSMLFMSSYSLQCLLVHITIPHKTTGVRVTFLWQCSGLSKWGGEGTLFIPASSNTFTLYFFLISSLVKLKEVPPVSTAVTMAFMLYFNRSNHCLSDTSFPKRVSDSPPLVCRLPR